MIGRNEVVWRRLPTGSLRHAIGKDSGDGARAVCGRAPSWRVGWLGKADPAVDLLPECRRCADLLTPPADERFTTAITTYTAQVRDLAAALGVGLDGPAFNPLERMYVCDPHHVPGCMQQPCADTDWPWYWTADSPIARITTAWRMTRGEVAGGER